MDIQSRLIFTPNKQIQNDKWPLLQPTQIIYTHTNTYTHTHTHAYTHYPHTHT